MTKETLDKAKQLQDDIYNLQSDIADLEVLISSDGLKIRVWSKYIPNIYEDIEFDPIPLLKDKLMARLARLEIMKKEFEFL